MAHFDGHERVALRFKPIRGNSCLQPKWLTTGACLRPYVPLCSVSSFRSILSDFTQKACAA